MNTSLSDRETTRAGRIPIIVYPIIALWMAAHLIAFAIQWAGELVGRSRRQPNGDGWTEIQDARIQASEHGASTP